MTKSKRGHDCWDASAYDGRHGFVWRLADDVLALLGARPGERVLDVGSGTGHLTARIAVLGADVLGIDSSGAMVEEARRNYPGIDFERADVRDYEAAQPFDAVFSNATLHWAGEPELVAGRVLDALRPGGRFVAEFDAQGNVRSIVDAVNKARRAGNATQGRPHDPWYFPDRDEYAAVLEDAGFRVRAISVIDRPTRLEDGERGLANWLRMFGSPLLEGLPGERAAEVIATVERSLKPALFTGGSWVADYKRIRVAAVKPRRGA